MPRAIDFGVLFLAFSSIAGISVVDGVVCEWKVNGPESLSYQGNEFLARGKFLVNSAGFVDNTGKVSDGTLQPKITANAKEQSVTQTFDWGVVKVAYIQQKSDLSLKIGVSNRSKLTLTRLSLDTLALRLPMTPEQYDGKQPMLGTNIGAPTLLPLDYKSGSLLVTNDDVRRPLLLGMPWSLNPPAKTIFPVRINIGRDPMYPDSLPLIDRPIVPGGSDEYDISLRFSSAPSDLTVSGRDLLMKFAGINNFSLNWPDRRPIGSLILATAATKWGTNPRGWLLDPTINIHSAEGLKDFHTRVLAWADRSIAILRKMNAQGMITWDIEGEQFPHPTTYIGDPPSGEKTAPEMAAIADDYFGRFRNAGLRVGVAIRPQRFELSGNEGKQVSSADPALELIHKISFAKRRWGATLFYIDSNGDAVNPLKVEVMTKIAQMFPDILLIPEHKNVAYYSRCAPYAELRGGHSATPGFVTMIYPNAFSVINTADGGVDKHQSELEAAVNRGDILMFRAWFDDPPNATIRALYAHSKFK